MNDCGYNQTYGLIYIKIHNFTTYVEFFTCYCFGGVFLMVNVKERKKRHRNPKSSWFWQKTTTKTTECNSFWRSVNSACFLEVYYFNI